MKDAQVELAGDTQRREDRPGGVAAGWTVRPAWRAEGPGSRTECAGGLLGYWGKDKFLNTVKKSSRDKEK